MSEGTPTSVESTLSRAALEAFRAHCLEHYLRLHHAVYLQKLLGRNADAKYSSLHPWMRQAINRFFDLVDRVALSNLEDQWPAGESESPSRRTVPIDQIISSGEEWIDDLKKQKTLILPYRWGSTTTQGRWDELIKDVKKFRQGHSDYFGRWRPLYNRTPQQYEIFTGGFEYVPVIGVFPFYSFGERLSAWSVFEYGKLNSLALVMNDRTARERVPWSAAGSVDRNEFRKRMTRIINPDEADDQIPLYYIGAGHAAVSLTSRLVQVADYWRLRTRIRPIPIPPPAVAAQLPRDAGTEERDVDTGMTEDEKAEEDRLRRSAQGICEVLQKPFAILFSDLGDPALARYLSDGEGKNRRPVILSVKGLRVPVGVGFSLATLPHFLEENGREATEGLVNTIRD
ncbi:MAG: hypothetical protein JO061_07815, partial [Acidobacteriaceae bacterium]|nr:hypothetical protein [Acidobacteriaceae bacterium]